MRTLPSWAPAFTTGRYMWMYAFSLLSSHPPNQPTHPFIHSLPTHPPTHPPLSYTQLGALHSLRVWQHFQVSPDCHRHHGRVSPPTHPPNPPTYLSLSSKHTSIQTTHPPTSPYHSNHPPTHLSSIYIQRGQRRDVREGGLPANERPLQAANQRGARYVNGWVGGWVGLVFACSPFPSIQSKLTHPPTSSSTRRHCRRPHGAHAPGWHRPRRVHGVSRRVVD